MDASFDKQLVAAAAYGSAPLRGMLRYALGNGKRLRPSLCLLLAQGYGAKRKALDAALAIEMFHNFTLVHDDIADHDEVRRGKPTLWKRFGTDHALNAGDVLSLLSIQRALACGPALSTMLLAAFLEVCEGQELDFTLGQMPLPKASQKMYSDMTEKKTAALIGAACEAAGIAAAAPAAERKKLRAFGRALGIAYQIADDYASVWSTIALTRKDSFSDIREKKRTLPILIAYHRSSPNARKRLEKLYALPQQLSAKEIKEVRTLIDRADAQAQVLREIERYTKKATALAQALSVSQKTRNELLSFVARIEA